MFSGVVGYATDFADWAVGNVSISVTIQVYTCCTDSWKMRLGDVSRFTLRMPTFTMKCVRILWME